MVNADVVITLTLPQRVTAKAEVPSAVTPLVPLYRSVSSLACVG